jgi:hypothetical protein
LSSWLEQRLGITITITITITVAHQGLFPSFLLLWWRRETYSCAQWLLEAGLPLSSWLEQRLGITITITITITVAHHASAVLVVASALGSALVIVAFFKRFFLPKFLLLWRLRESLVPAYGSMGLRTRP